MTVKQSELFTNMADILEHGGIGALAVYDRDELMLTCASFAGVVAAFLNKMDVADLFVAHLRNIVTVLEEQGE